MKHPVILTLSAVLTLSGLANASRLTASADYPQATVQTSADSTSTADEGYTTDLAEIVVQGRTQRAIKYGVEYTPDKKTRRAAMDATSLLRLMAIPQLEILPGSTAVTMTGGREVKQFIDYQPATEQDLQGMRPEDVVRVEVLDYPQDPRFQSAQYVVNYIMQKYEWGGYTKASGSITPLSIIDGYGALYSKFNYKNWTFDANAGGSASRNTREKGYSQETFRDFNFAGTHIDCLDRISQTDNTLIKNNSQWASLRAVYSVKNIYLSHTLSFNRSATPDMHSTSTVDFSKAILPSTESFTSETGSNVSPAILGNYYFVLPRGNSITLYWDFSYGRNKRNSLYQIGRLMPIVNDNVENVYAPHADLQYSKNLPYNNTFRTSLMTYNYIYDTRYEGSYHDSQKLLSSENMLFLEYMQNWNSGLSLYSRLGMSYVIGRVNGATTLRQWNPRLGLQLRYRFNNRHAASVSGWWGNSHPGPESSNTALVQQTELLWLQGNPDLRNTLFQLVSLSYDFIPTDKLSFSLYAQYEGNPHKQAYEYMVLPGYDGLVRRVINSGSAHDWQVNLSGSLRLFDNSLTLKAAVMADRVVLTGIDARSLNDYRAGVSANYFLGHFTFSGYYSSPAKHLGGWSYGTCSTRRSRYGLEIGFASGNFKATLGSDNWWNKARVYNDFNSDHFSSAGWTWNSGDAPRLNLALSYTISYGRKVNHDDEVSSKGGVGSAILK
ncbi:MAG: outer membrane beta-barrel family protein [Muribaculaceae bacterium]|nr:outer membrane beta-barrel family protein [Muribaculaceae bacterium]